MVFVAQIEAKPDINTLPAVLAIEPEKEAIGLYLGVLTATYQVGMGIAEREPQQWR